MPSVKNADGIFFESVKFLMGNDKQWGLACMADTDLRVAEIGYFC